MSMPTSRALMDSLLARFYRGSLVALLLLTQALGLGWSPWALAQSSSSSPPVAGAKTGRLVVTSGDRPRPVWLGEQFLGSTPVAADSIRVGTWELRVGEPLREHRWVVPYVRQVEIRSNRETEIVLPSLQRLQLHSFPLSSRVWIDDREVGHTPLSALVPAAQPLSLRLGGDGLTMTEIDYHGAFRADSLLEVAVPTLPGLAMPRQASSSPWFREREYWLPVGAVLAGAAGVWARQTADRAYDDYLSTVDRDELKRHFDRARNYDRVAVGFWVTAEVLLIGAAWSWLHDESDSADPLLRLSSRDGQMQLGLSLDRWWGGGDRPEVRGGVGP